MKKLIAITALIMLLATAILPQTGCNGETKKAEPTYEELQQIQQETGPST